MARSIFHSDTMYQITWVIRVPQKSDAQDCVCIWFLAIFFTENLLISIYMNRVERFFIFYGFCLYKFKLKVWYPQIVQTDHGDMWSQDEYAVNQPQFKLVCHYLFIIIDAYLGFWFVSVCNIHKILLCILCTHMHLLITAFECIL